MSNHVETQCIHGNSDFSFREETHSVAFPLYQTATFGHLGLGHSTGFDYTREKNPTRQHLEETITALEHGVDTVAFSSGMAAISACFELFRPGDQIICSEDLYGGTTRLLNTVSAKNGLTVNFVDSTNLDNMRTVLMPAAKALYIETPSNPMMNVTDLRACAALAKEHGLLLIVDNTFLSPYLQNPLTLGADIVLHSGSKFISGHNDTIAGFLTCADQELADRVRLIAKTTGGMLAPFDCWLTIRGLKTLSVRMERQQANARGPLAAGPARHREGVLRRPAGASRLRGKRRTGQGQRQHDLLPHRHRRDRPQDSQSGEAHHLCGKPGRHRKPHHLSAHPDPPGRARENAPAAGHYRHAAAALRWSGVCG